MGSRSTKAVYLNGGRKEMAMTDTFDLIEKGPFMRIPEGILVVTTGYGRRIPGNYDSIPEIRAHAIGAVETLGIGDFTLLDIGGQDYKVVRVEKGGIRDFFMNDKCAAGTGRFLEKMADMLCLGVEELGARKGSRKLLESTCSVFSETEIIGMKMEGFTTEEIAEGVIYSVYERIRPLLRSFPTDRIVFTGGVSAFSGLKDTISDQIGVEVIVPENAQYMGALGCARAVIRR
ncbi:MAG: acyl-CoA dehydratase activase [Thermoplasmatota archaeon]